MLLEIRNSIWSAQEGHQLRRTSKCIWIVASSSHPSKVIEQLRISGMMVSDWIDRWKWISKMIWMNMYDEWRLWFWLKIFIQVGQTAIQWSAFHWMTFNTSKWKCVFGRCRSNIEIRWYYVMRNHFCEHNIAMIIHNFCILIENWIPHPSIYLRNNGMWRFH